MTNHRIIPRSEWGARYANGFGLRPVGNLTTRLHHSVTLAPDLLPPFDDDYRAVRALEAIGQSRFGKGMSYNTVFTPAGLIFEGLGIDRVGAHTGGANTKTAGLVLLGNYEKDRPSEPMLEALTWYLHYGVGRWWKDAKLDGGHRDVAQTACPGKYAYDLIDNINRGEFVSTRTPQEEPDMDANDKQVAADTLEILKDLRDGKVPTVPISMARDSETITLRATLRDIRMRTGSLLAELNGLRTVVETLANNQNLDPERIYKLVDKNLQAATADLKITLSTDVEDE